LEVNYEAAPLHSHFDLVDVTDSKWRALHPTEKGFWGPVGGTFTSTFPEVSAADGPSGAKAALAKLVADYNQSDYPGKYIVRPYSGGQFTVIGTRVRDDSGDYHTLTPVLDTPILISREQRSVYDSVYAIFNALSSKVGTRMFVMSFPNNEFDKEVTLGGDEIPARDLLQQALAATGRPTLYDLGYDPNEPVYILNVYVAMKAQNDSAGHRKPVAIDRLINH